MSNSLPPVEPPKALLIGVGRPLNYVPTKGGPDYIGEPFPNALGGFEESGGFPFVFQRMLAPKNEIDVECISFAVTTIREFNMLQFMNTITDKQNWHIKVQPLPPPS
jgi:hypothetical protein